MKTFLQAICISSFMFLSFTASAQVKLGHINVVEIIYEMPGISDLEKQLDAFAQELEVQNTDMLTEYQTKLDEYQKKEAVMMDAVKEIKQQELLDLENRIYTFQQTAQEKLAQKESELLEPFLVKVNDAIQSFAKENGYTYIFDISAGTLAYYGDTNDVSAQIKSKLGIQ